MQTLFKDLKSLKKIIKPDTKWKERTHREIVSFAQKTTYKTKKQQRSLLSFHGTSFIFRIAPIFVCLILLIIVPSTVIASKSSRPGQILYPVKRLIEKGQFAIAKDEKQNELIGQFSEERASELEQAVQMDTEEDQLTAVFELKSSTEKVMRLVKLERRAEIIRKLKGRLTKIKPKITSPKVLRFISQILIILEESQNISPTPKKQQDKNSVKIILPTIDASITPVPVLSPSPTMFSAQSDTKQQEEFNPKQSVQLEPTTPIVTSVQTTSKTVNKKVRKSVRLRQLIKRVIQNL